MPPKPILPTPPSPKLPPRPLLSVITPLGDEGDTPLDPQGHISSTDEPTNKDKTPAGAIPPNPRGYIYSLEEHKGKAPAQGSTAPSHIVDVRVWGPKDPQPIAPGVEWACPGPRNQGCLMFKKPNPAESTECGMCGVRREDVVVCQRCQTNTLKYDVACARWLHERMPCSQNPLYGDIVGLDQYLCMID